MEAMMKHFYAFLCSTYRSPYTAVLGVAIGAGGMWIKDSKNEVEAQARRDRDLPVVSVKSTLIHHDDAGVLIHAGPGEKLRECEYLGMQGFVRQADGLLGEVNAKRVDMPESSKTRPVGKFVTFGDWLLSPNIPGATRAYLFINYDCNGYTKASTIADVSLEPEQ